MQVHEKLFIGGEWVAPAGSDVIEVISPHSEEVVGRVPEGTTADIDRAVAAARKAFDEGEWPRLSPEDRIAAVQRFADVYAVRMMDMARSEEHTSELQSLMRSSYAVFCLKKKQNKPHNLNLSMI